MPSSPKSGENEQSIQFELSSDSGSEQLQRLKRQMDEIDHSQSLISDILSYSMTHSMLKSMQGQ
jgi:hypothetical protein